MLAPIASIHGVDPGLSVHAILQSSTSCAARHKDIDGVDVGGGEGGGPNMGNASRV